MANANTELHKLDGSLVWSGFKQLTPMSFFVTAFGAAFGIAATQAGLSEPLIIGMSILVYAGAAQFATLDLWGEQIPLFTMMITVFAINARHLLMGATLYPWLCKLSPAKQYGVTSVVSDANWAMAMQAFGRGKPGLGIVLGGGLSLWVFWVSGTVIGTYFGSAISDPKRLGLDMILGCFLVAMMAGGQKNLRVLMIWIVAGLSAMLAYWYLPENIHVIIGALAGGIAGVLLGEQGDES